MPSRSQSSLEEEEEGWTATGAVGVRGFCLAAGAADPVRPVAALEVAQAAFQVGMIGRLGEIALDPAVMRVPGCLLDPPQSDAPKCVPDGANQDFSSAAASSALSKAVRGLRYTLGFRTVTWGVHGRANAGRETDDAVAFVKYRGKAHDLILSAP